MPWARHALPSALAGSLGLALVVLCGCLSVPEPPGGSIDCQDGNAFVEVVAGRDHACGRTEDGAVFCWGANGFGQLGTGDLIPSGVPTPIVETFTAVALAAGDDHTCAIDAEAQAWCWGRNSDAQLGRGTRGSSGRAPAVVFASGADEGGVALDDVIRIAAGEKASCALRESGAVWCWGENDDGEAGGTGGESSVEQAAPVAGLPAVVDLAMGGSVGCAWTEQGALFCWGSNGQSQLGETGPDGFSAEPVEIGAVGAVTTVALDDHSCAATTSGELRCWGDSDDGVLGIEAEESAIASPVLVPLPDSPEVVDLAAGEMSSCAVTAEGRVYCWGTDNEGELGADRHGTHTSPVEVIVSSPAIAIDAGARHTCAVLNDGGVRCWGSDRLGQLGRTARLTSLTPFRIDMPFEVDRVALGDDHTCVVDQDGGVHCWGANNNGQVGSSGFERATEPRAVPGLSDVEAIQAGDDFTCAQVGGSGGPELWCWGENDDGQVTGEGGGKETSPRQLTGIETGELEAFSAFDDNACALIAGEPQCWGESYEGFEAAAVEGASLITAGRTFACASDGEDVWCWGDGGAGQLGDGNRDNRSLDDVATAGLTASGAVETLASGNRHVIAIVEGAVYGWGRSGEGQLGDGLGNVTPAPVALIGAPASDAAATAGDATCVRSVAHELWCFGNNAGGRLGTGSRASQEGSPSPLPGLEGVVSFDLGNFHGCAATEDGELWCWGSDLDGRRGEGRELTSSEPVAPEACD